MRTIDVVALPAKDDGDAVLWNGGPGRYDYDRLNGEMRLKAMAAEGRVVEGLACAVKRVIDAGDALALMKRMLPHGEYLPWVQQACGLKPDYAARLIKAAEWASNVEHAPYLDGVTDATTLFLLSAETTSEEVREWFMERCAAGDPPTRAEVQERKRASGRPRVPRPAENLALSWVRKGEVDRMREALALADRAVVVTAEDVMAEQRLRDLGKLRFIAGADADFHRMKGGEWIRMPHFAGFEPNTGSEAELSGCDGGDPCDANGVSDMGMVVTHARAAELMGMKVETIRQALWRAGRDGDGSYYRNGWIATRSGRGKVRIEKREPPVTPR